MFAHPAGLCTLAFHPNGERFVTGGSDDTLKLWDFEKLETINSVELSMDDITTIAFKSDGTEFACGSKDNSVQLFRFPECSFSSTSTRLTGAVHDVSYNHNGTILAVAGDDVATKLVCTLDSSQVSVLQSQCSTRSVSFSPDGKHMAAAGTDGRLLIWDVSKKAVVCTLRSVESMTSASHAGFKCSWGHNFLAVPSFKDVAIVDPETNKVAFKLTDEHSDSVVIVQMSPNGRYVASTGDDCKLVVWDLKSKSSVAVKCLDKSCSSFAWNPKQNAIVYVLNSGVIHRWNDVVPSHLCSPITLLTRTVAMASIFENENDEITSVSEESEGDNDGEEKCLRKRLRRHPRFDGECRSDDDNGSDWDCQQGDDYEGDSGYERREGSAFRSGLVQATFQPGSSSFEHGNPCLHAWDLSGNMVSTQVDDHTRRVQISFADINTRDRISFTDRFNFSMGSLCDTGAVLACRRQGEHPNLIPSTVFFKPFESWAPNSDWRLNLRGDEDVTCVGLSKRFVAIASSAHNLRILSSSGVQKNCLSMPGPVISMTGLEYSLFVVYSAVGNAHLDYMLLDVSKSTCISQGFLPLSPASTLNWIGFLPNGIPLTMDSQFMFRCLFNNFGYSWTPILDASLVCKSKSDTIWPVGATEKQILYAHLRNGQRYPKAHNLPILSPAAFSIPMLDSGIDALPLEEEAMRSRLFYHNKLATVDPGSLKKEQRVALTKMQAAIDTCAIKMMQKSCEQGCPARALDLVSSLMLPASFDIALRVAALNNDTELSQRISVMIQYKKNMAKEKADSAQVPATKAQVQSAESSPQNQRQRKRMPPKAVEVADLSDSDAEVQDENESSPNHAKAMDGKATLAQTQNQTSNMFAAKRPTSASKGTPPRPGQSKAGFENPFSQKSTPKRQKRSLFGSSATSNQRRSLFSP